MQLATPLTDDKKLTVTYRVEPGCLGPEGLDKIDDFCNYAQKQLASLDSDYVVWVMVPRRDKNLPEMQYSVLNKNMNHSQAERYLSRLGKHLDEFEAHLVDKLASLIDSYPKT